MKFAIRVDASQVLGSGHVMRCLALADELRARNGSVLFLCRELPEHLRTLLTEHGHTVDLLDATAPADQSLDAAACRAALAGQGMDGLIVDHYSLDRTWESAMRGVAGRIAAIDDVGRSHDCDVLLDQNFYFDAPARYAGRVPSSCELLLGPRYALLRPEFAAKRAAVRPRDGEVRRVLVFFGGMDSANLTETALLALQLLERRDLAIDVVIGTTHPARARIEALCATLRASCHVQTTDMAGLLAKADLAIGAGGSATWERCALGVPAVSVCVAENQRELLVHGARRGFVYVPDEFAHTPESLSVHLRALLANSGLRNHLSQTGFTLVDAAGVRRVAGVIARPQVSIRVARADDCEALHAWRNDVRIRSVSGDQHVIPLEEHQRWFHQVLQSRDRFLLIGEQGGAAVGVVRFDANQVPARISIYLAPEQIGSGAGTALLRAAEAWLREHHPEVELLDADVLVANSPSLALFERCQYDRHMVRFSKRLSA